jgi:glycosyltransferase involved in cell wall biosynthesis
MPSMTRITMLLENNSYPLDPRVRPEAEALARAGYDVTVCAPRADGQPRRETLRGVRVHRWRLPPTSDTKTGFLLEYLFANLQLHWAGLRELLRGSRVLHLHNPPDTLFPIAFLARLLGRKVVYDQHDLVPELIVDKFGDGPHVKATELCERLSMRAADLVIANNESGVEVARERGGHDGSSVVVVRNGPPRAALASPEAQRSGALDDPHLVFVGFVEVQDAAHELPDLLVRLERDHGIPRARVTIVGGGAGLALVKRAAEELGVQERVRMTGLVPHTEIPRLLAEADICIDPAPSTAFNQTSTNIKIAEYMAAARPIVAYELLETKRTAGDAALLAGAGDPAAFAALVARLAADGAERERRGQAGLARVQDLVWERQEERLIGAYEQLVGSGAN